MSSHWPNHLYSCKISIIPAPPHVTPVKEFPRIILRCTSFLEYLVLLFLLFFFSKRTTAQPWCWGKLPSWILEGMFESIVFRSTAMIGRTRFHIMPFWTTNTFSSFNWTHQNDIWRPGFTTMARKSYFTYNNLCVRSQGIYTEAGPSKSQWLGFARTWEMRVSFPLRSLREALFTINSNVNICN